MRIMTNAESEGPSEGNSHAAAVQSRPERASAAAPASTVEVASTAITRRRNSRELLKGTATPTS